MLATSGPIPVGLGWAFEVKFDGVRAIGYAGRDGLRLYSRNDRDISRSYPEVAALELGKGVIVDGELVALDEHGRPDFGLLQHRMHITTPTPELIARVPVQYVVFDLLHRKERSLLELPYGRRRELLDRLDLERPGLRVPANFTDITGDLVMAAIAQQGLEGVVAKRLVSPYQPGRRSRAWIKTPIRHTAEVIIAGWSPSTGNADVLGSLLLAAYDPDGELVYVGDVGTGFTDGRPPAAAGAAAAPAPRRPAVRRAVRAGPGLGGTTTEPRPGALGGATAGRGDRVPVVHPRGQLPAPLLAGDTAGPRSR